jgi:DNA (cytosine-5)-methyltransferase 1
MNGLSLCSGIGGIDLGLRLAVPSYRTVCHVEIDARCQDVLLARMADGLLDRARIWGDLKAFDGREWRGVDLVHGGYPCQPFSAAGKRRGADDPRHLWPHIRGIVDAVGPEWCLFENVAGHLSRGAPEVVSDLVAMGYRVAFGLFTASELGGSHERKRLFILGHRDVLAASSVQGGEPDAGRAGGGRAGVPVCGGLRRPGEQAPPRIAAVVGPWPPPPRDPDWRDVVAADASLAPWVDVGGEPRVNPTFVEWLMGFPRGWTEGVPRATRLAMLGNAVVPAMAALAWSELSAAFLHGEIPQEIWPSSGRRVTVTCLNCVDRSP